MLGPGEHLRHRPDHKIASSTIMLPDKPKILIVEDNDDLRSMLGRLLTIYDYEVETAVHGAHALRILSVNDVDLIVSDVNMPIMDGRELLRRVRENLDWARIPFLFLTVESKAQNVRTCKEEGADGYLVKPFAMADLAAAIKGHLRRAEEWQRLPIG